MSGPAARVTALTATGFSVTLTGVTGVPGTIAKLQTRALGSAVDWTTQVTKVAPAVGDVVSAAGLATGTSLEWRAIEEIGATVHDGTHGIVTPAESPWDTLTATISAALQGQGLPAGRIYIGRQPEPNYADVIAILRTLQERVDRRANNVERIIYPIEVEIRVTLTDDHGGLQKTEIEKWQERLRAALHERHALDFPGVPGLEETTVEVASKDAQSVSGPEGYLEDLRARAIVHVGVWRGK